MKTGTVLLGCKSGIGSTKSPQVKSLEIVGKRWTDSYGNTYHNARVYVNDQDSFTTPTQYGYGDQYVQSAFAALKKKGYFKRTPETDLNSYTMRKRKIKFSAKARDVKRKKDLENPNYF
jgi:hypothetical protein